MSDTPEHESADSLPTNPPIVTPSELEVSNWLGAISNSDAVDCDELSDLFRRGASATENLASQRACNLLAALCGFSFRPADKATVYGPSLVMDGRRSAIPADFRGEQTEILSSIISKIEHPGLKARIADTVWLNGRKNRSAAEAAIDGYCGAVEAVASGRLRHRFETASAVSRRTLDYLERALTISAAITKDRSIDPRLKELVLATIDKAEHLKDLGAFHRIAGLAFRYDLVASDEVASRAESLASGSSADPLSRQRVFQLAARAFRDTKSEEASRRCRLEAAEMLVRMAEGMNSAMASAHWLIEAIREMRTIPNTKSRRKELEEQLREQQNNALEEMGSFSLPLDLENLRQTTEEALSGLSLAEALNLIATWEPSISTEDLRTSALEQLASSPLSSMMSMTHIDSRDGKVVSVSPGAPLTEQPSEGWFERQFCQHEKMHRLVVVAGSFEPARKIVARSFSISERHFAPISEASPFVPAGYEQIFALGFARLFQGDMLSAAHLLLPQLENSIRHVMRLRGSDPTIIQSDMKQEDRSLSAMIETDRASLEAVFGEALVGEIDRLFNSRVGPALRHEMAHGKLAASHCFSPDVVYACWLIFKITCIPLLEEAWGRHVAGAIDSEGT